MANKQFATMEVKAIDDGDAGGFEAVLSAPTLDRDGEVIDYGAFDPLPNSIPILADHEASVRSLVGRAQPFYDGQVLKVRGKFASNDFAQYCRGLLLDGTLDSMSVGFMQPERTTRDSTPHITRAEILEGSFVVIPSNRQAAVVMAKSFGLSDEVAEVVAEDLLTHKGGSRNAKADQEAIDAIHDYAVKAGANCPNMDTPTEKDDPKSVEPEIKFLNDAELFLFEHEVRTMLDTNA